MSYFNEMRPDEKALDKKLRREAIIEIICGILTIPFMVLLAYMFLAATPEQMSAERDALSVEMIGGTK